MPKHQEIMPWVSTDSKVAEWVVRLAKNSKPTAYGYASQLFVYWRTALSKKFKTLEEWVSEVKQQSKSDDFDLQSKWVRQAEDFILTRVSPTNQETSFDPSQATTEKAIILL